MLPPFALRVLRVGGVLLVLFGLAVAAVGGIGIASTPAPQAYHGVSAEPVDAPANATPLTALNESQRALATQAIEAGEARGSPSVAASLDGQVVEAENGTYRLDAYERPPETDPFAYVLYGGLLATVLGFFTALASHAVLKLA